MMMLGARQVRASSPRLCSRSATENSAASLKLRVRTRNEKEEGGQSGPGKEMLNRNRKHAYATPTLTLLVAFVNGNKVNRFRNLEVKVRTVLPCSYNSSGLLNGFTMILFCQSLCFFLVPFTLIQLSLPLSLSSSIRMWGERCLNLSL